MQINTASQIISFIKDIENSSSNYYNELSRRFPDKKDIFEALAKENQKYLKHIERAYYSVITDAMEGGFAFDIDTSNYQISHNLKESLSYKDAIDEAVSMEENIIRFYSEAVEQSDSLMADIPKALKYVTKKRNSRLEKLKQLLCEE